VITTLTKNKITVATPTIPPRGDLLRRAAASVAEQTLPAAAHAVAIDTERRGAGATRQAALDLVTTEWTAFLDDDDEFMPRHLEYLYGFAMDTGADYVYSYYVVKNAKGEETKVDPLQNFGQPFDPKNPRHTTITILVRTDLAKSIGFHTEPQGHDWGGEDWMFTLGCVRAEAKILHLPEKTWYWWHHGNNTSGLATRW
jgi:glycosyltransferase involved in cell wall biosynthesis